MKTDIDGEISYSPLPNRDVALLIHNGKLSGITVEERYDSASCWGSFNPELAWVEANGWTTIREWINGGPVYGPTLVEELRSALQYYGG